MNIHEYQARELFGRYGVATTRGFAARSPKEAEKAAKDLSPAKAVVKAQIHAGGRGKGHFKNGFQGGVHICDTPEQARKIAESMLGQTLITHQTGPEGRVVNNVLVTEAARIAKEYYFAILLDRAVGSPVVVVSTEGGMDIEAVAKATPERIIREGVDPLLGLQAYQTRKLARDLGLAGAQLQEASKIFLALYKLFIACDCTLLEVNPLVATTEGKILALDAKFNFDDNALFRHPDIVALRDIAEEDPREVAASKFNLNYIGLDGNIACMVNGAGLAMATMDIIKFYGGSPANFLDVGGGASEQQVTEAFQILSSDPKVKAILVNIFGGIMQCDIIAQGIINSVKIAKLAVPLVVRLEGTNVEVGKKLLQHSGLPIITVTDLADAAEKAVKAAEGG